MKINLIFIAAIALLPVACIKETNEIENPATAEKSNCTGNTWVLDNLYNGHKNEKPLVYNNKVYVFDVVNNEVRIYDGTNWNSIPSRIPYTGNYNFGFTIGDKGYLGNIKYLYNDPFFWEYDFATNDWAQKANFPGFARFGPSAFAIGNKGYVASGLVDIGQKIPVNLNDTWEYNQATDSWTKKASFPPFHGRWNATGFSISNKGYIVNGQIRFPDFEVYLNSLLEYNPVTDTWTSKAIFPGESRAKSSVFVISGVAYAGGGFTYAPNVEYLKDYYKYTPVTNSWEKVANATVPNLAHFGFSINSRGYVIFDGANTDFMLKYIPKTCLIPPLN